MTHETTTEGVRGFLNRKGIKEEVFEELKTIGPYKAFKLGFPFKHLRLTTDGKSGILATGSQNKDISDQV
jgi:hypothetical protein